MTDLTAQLTAANLLANPSQPVDGNGRYILVWAKGIGPWDSLAFDRVLDKSPYLYRLGSSVQVGNAIVAGMHVRPTEAAGATLGSVVQSLRSGGAGFGQAQLTLRFVVNYPVNGQGPLETLQGVASVASTSPQLKPDLLGLGAVGDLLSGAAGWLKTVLALLVILALVYIAAPLARRA